MSQRVTRRRRSPSVPAGPFAISDVWNLARGVGLPSAVLHPVPALARMAPPADYLAEIPQDATPDVYGEGGVVEELEREVASILGKLAAVFLPSGTMARQIALRVHADRRSRRTILFHPTCPLDHFEG